MPANLAGIFIFKRENNLEYLVKDNMNFLANLLNQVEILRIGLTLLSLRKLITKENFDDLYNNMFPNKYFTGYLIILWFVLIPWLATYFKWEPFGIWGSIYKQSSSFFWLALIMIIIINCFMLYQIRKEQK